MFTTARTTVQQAIQAALQQATALGLAAVVTFGILASVNGLATAPAADSLLAANAAQVALVKVAAKS